MNIAILPARSGSKRIKNKNIHIFYGKPLIAHTLSIIKDSKLFNQIIVSTDSKQIANIAKKNGAGPGTGAARRGRAAPARGFEPRRRGEVGGAGGRVWPPAAEALAGAARRGLDDVEGCVGRIGPP